MSHQGHPGAVLGTHQGPGPRGHLPGETGRLRGFSVGWHTPWLLLKLSGSSGAVLCTSGCVLGILELPRLGRQDLGTGAHLSTRSLRSGTITTFPAASSRAGRRNHPLLSSYKRWSAAQRSSVGQMSKISLGTWQSTFTYILVTKASFKNPWAIKQREPSVCHHKLSSRQPVSEGAL